MAGARTSGILRRARARAGPSRSPSHSGKSRKIGVLETRHGGPETMARWPIDEVTHQVAQGDLRCKDEVAHHRGASRLSGAPGAADRTTAGRRARGATRASPELDATRSWRARPGSDREIVT